MLEFLLLFSRSLFAGCQSHSGLMLENLALRHQLAVLKRQARKPILSNFVPSRKTANPYTQVRSMKTPMKTLRARNLGAITLASCLFTAAVGASDFTIGLKFGSGDHGNDGPQPTDVAGFLPQANWNILSDASGSFDGAWADVNGTSTPTSTHAEWEGNNTWSTGNFGDDGINFQTGTPDYYLMASYLDSSASSTTTILISNLPTELTDGGYSVYVYGQAINAGQGGSYGIVDADTGIALGAPQFLMVPNDIRDYILTAETNWPPSVPGNVIAFRGLTNAGIRLYATPTNGNGRAEFQAVQLVATHVAAEPAAVTGLQVGQSAPGSLNLSWKTNAGTSGSLVILSAGAYGISRRPVDGVAYAANAAFGSGQHIGGGNYVVYSGPATNLTVTGLFTVGPYSIGVFPYQGSPASDSVNYRIDDPALGSSGTIVPLFSIAPQPISQDALAGGTATFTSGAVGLAPMRYLWQKNAGSGWVDMVNDSRVSGANTNVLKIANLTAADAVTYRMIVTNGVPLTLTSSVVTLRVNAESIAVQFGGSPANAATYLPPNAVAGVGVLPQPFWTVIKQTGAGAGNAGSTPALVQNLGSPTLVKLDWHGNNSWNTGGEIADNDGKMMWGYLKSYNVPALGPDGIGLTFSGLTPGGGPFELNLYGNDADSAGGMPVVAVEAGGIASYWQQPFKFQGQHIIAMSTNDSSNPSSGTCLHLTGLYADIEGVLFITNTWVSGGGAYGYNGFGIAGLQLVSPSAAFPRSPLVIQQQPGTNFLYAGRSGQFYVGAISGYAPISYQWQKSIDGGSNWANVEDGSRYTGARTARLTVAKVNAADVGLYRAVCTDAKFPVPNTANSAGGGLLLVAAPPANSFEAMIVGLDPIAYYRLNEQPGETNAFDYCGGHNGGYELYATDGLPSITTAGFELSNTCFQPAASGLEQQQSSVRAPIGMLAVLSNVTITLWIYPNVSPQGAGGPGLFIDRLGPGGGGGLGYTADGQYLACTWNTNTLGTNVMTSPISSGLETPAGLWSLVALVVTPQGPAFYVCNANGLASTNVPIALATQTFGNDWRIGHDRLVFTANAMNPDALIDEVAVFGSALSADQIAGLYLAGNTGLSQRLQIAPRDQNVILTWSQGTLLQAPTVNGPWTANSAATSPFTNAASGTQFYRLQIPFVP